MKKNNLPNIRGITNWGHDPLTCPKFHSHYLVFYQPHYMISSQTQIEIPMTEQEPTIQCKLDKKNKTSEFSMNKNSYKEALIFIKPTINGQKIK